MGQKKVELFYPHFKDTGKNEMPELVDYHKNRQAQDEL